MSVARAFVTSECAEAHVALFREIVAIVKEDTGEDLKFWHIHDEGIQVMTMDEHKGQALGKHFVTISGILFIVSIM